MRPVLVVGDIIVDVHTEGERLGLSAETPTIVAKHVETRRTVGGAALVARHLVRLGREVILLSVSSDHGAVDDLRASFTNDERHLLDVVELDVPGWTHSTKHRFFVEGYKLFQLDTLNKGRWSSSAQLIETVSRSLPGSDELVICDNRHGVLSSDCPERLIELARKEGKPVHVDSQVSQSESNLERYAGCTTAFVNERELFALLEGDELDGVFHTLLKIAEKKMVAKVVLKLGARGSMTCDDGHVPAHVVPAVDTCGAGDAFLAAYVSSGGDMKFANWWAARSTLYYGTEVPPREEPRP